MPLAAFGWTEQRQQTFGRHRDGGLVPGRVVGEHRTHYRIAIGETELSAITPGRVRNAASLRSELPGVGDFVAVRLAPGDGQATIEAVLPRTSALIRKASGKESPQLLAANVDVAFIVTGLDGDYNLARIERFLTLVRESGAMPVIVANKVDVAGDTSGVAAELATVAAGAPVHMIGARGGLGMADLERYFDGNRTIVLIGSSGVGKSTMINQFLGRAAQETQDVRGHDSRGRHTTTHRQLFLRPLGGSIIDTPGMRGLEVWSASEASAPDFSDIDGLAAQCKFRNCGHRSEPGCAVRGAIAGGRLEAERLAAYLNSKR